MRNNYAKFITGSYIAGDIKIGKISVSWVKTRP